MHLFYGLFIKALLECFMKLQVNGIALYIPQEEGLQAYAVE